MVEFSPGLLTVFTIGKDEILIRHKLWGYCPFDPRLVGNFELASLVLDVLQHQNSACQRKLSLYFNCV